MYCRPQHLPHTSQKRTNIMSNTSAARSAVKPNSARRRAIRLSLPSVCMTCDLALCWSRETGAKDAGAGTLGHVVADVLGGTYAPGNIGAQCWACNWDAKTAGAHDLTRDVVAGSIPTRYLPQRVADARADVRDVAPATVPGWDARRAARKARGLAW